MHGALCRLYGRPQADLAAPDVADAEAGQHPPLKAAGGAIYRPPLTQQQQKDRAPRHRSIEGIAVFSDLNLAAFDASALPSVLLPSMLLPSMLLPSMLLPSSSNPSSSLSSSSPSSSGLQKQY